MNWTTPTPDAMPPGLPVLEPGWVWLVGAGPGDPGLLTVHALNALSQADTVVYDALVDRSILALARPGAEMIYAGKRGGKPSAKQVDISSRLIHFARAGRRVLRLKGGDPFVFGRGGEEALALVGAGVPFRIVPGVTAGIGGLAYAGIPVTHRDVNSAITFITGHNSFGEVPDGLDWAALARGSPVLVIYMAMKKLDRIAETLIGHGRPAEEPAAVVSDAATDRQRVLVSTLSRVANEAEADGMRPPAILVVGDAVRMRAGLDWLGAMSGVRLDPDPLGRSDRSDSALSG